MEENNTTNLGGVSTPQTIMGLSRELTAGEKAVGITFNLGGDPRVNEVKSLMAKVFDIVEASTPADDGTIPTARKRKLRDAALQEIITAQMWAVKVITYQI